MICQRVSRDLSDSFKWMSDGLREDFERRYDFMNLVVAKFATHTLPPYFTVVLMSYTLAINVARTFY